MVFVRAQDLQLGDIFSWDTGPGASSPVGSPRRDSASQPGSPGGIGAGRESPFQGTGQARVSPTSTPTSFQVLPTTNDDRIVQLISLMNNHAAHVFRSYLIP